MHDSALRLMRVAAARADFLESGLPGAVGVPEVIAASWERSQAAGVDIAAARADYEDRIDPESLLARCAHPVLQQLGNDTADLPLVIALTDNRARVLRRIDSSPAVGRLLDRVNLAPGFEYSEGSMGTNGVGTVFEAGQPVSVVGPEHFAESLQSFACTGAPIIDPVTGRVEGVLDISSLSSTWNPIMHTLVKSAAKDISRNLLLDRNQSKQALFETYLGVESRSPRQAVFAFAESVFIANTVAQELFNSAEQATLRDHAMFLMSRRDRASDTLDLPTGRTVRIRGTRILAGSAMAGMVVIADAVAGVPEMGLPPIERMTSRLAPGNEETPRIVDAFQSPYESIAGGNNPAWRRANSQLRAALKAQQPSIVIGETGSGKFTLIAEIFHELYPEGRSVSLDASALGAATSPTDLSPMIERSGEQTLHIVRNLDQANTDGVDRIEELLAGIEKASGPTWVVATVSDTSLDSDLPFRALLHHFDTAVTVPPLRLRNEDLSAIVGSLLRSLAPTRKVRLSPDAQRAIATYGWPRNVTQLSEALSFALRRRPVGEIQGCDLPGYCSTSSRRLLTPLESAERDTIVATLVDHNGNRVQAAQQLGMSRSSLYRKIKSYGIKT